ncbi:MAG: hypothetical protein JNN07_16385 [Verrucomicrobiales bacterium]|jgi:hypothetical protein|nr:hypothetical protein [Verrucomicrobiales bacterium]
MQKRTSVLLSTVLLLAVLYVSYFTDWFGRQSIQIIVQHRPIPQRADPAKNLDAPPVFPVSFAFSRKYELTSLKVVKTEELASQKFPTPLWHLVSETNSGPTKAMVYGIAPRGMRPAVEDAQPEPLVAGVSYTLLVEAGKMKGSTNFVPLKATVARR